MKRTFAWIAVVLAITIAITLKAHQRKTPTGEIAQMARETFRTAFESPAVRAVFGLEEEETKEVFFEDSAGFAL